MSEVMCKGDVRLGTACGKCSRCFDAQRLRADTAEAERDTLRELLRDIQRCGMHGLQVNGPSIAQLRNALRGCGPCGFTQCGAAPQRIAELRGCGPKGMREAARSAAPHIPGDVIDHILACAIAALNQKSEGRVMPIRTEGSNLHVRDDIELTQAALEACGYRVHLRERAGTRWVTACKGLQVQYTHWHPLTNIHQAMQLLQDADLRSSVMYYGASVQGDKLYGVFDVVCSEPSPADLINAQCRAIVTACASLKGVR